MSRPARNQMMVAEPRQAFGGDWTETKLGMVKDYLTAYTQALKNQPFAKMYVDAFAGTGYREADAEPSAVGFFAEQAEAEDAGYFDGSAKLALEIEIPFDRYVFIEKSRRRMAELQAMTATVPGVAGRVDFRPGDANELIPHICGEIDWRSTRAVLFLDPFGMAVDWRTMQAIAATRAMDVWILFPAGVGVNRLLKDDPAQIPPAWKSRLDRIFGTPEWSRAFYRTRTQQTLFGEEERTERVPDSVRAIVGYYQSRLQTIFAKVADNPRYLCNSKNSPMFVLTFAVGNPNPRAQEIAMKIARYILGKRR